MKILFKKLYNQNQSPRPSINVKNRRNYPLNVLFNIISKSLMLSMQKYFASKTNRFLDILRYYPDLKIDNILFLLCPIVFVSKRLAIKS